MKIGMILTDLKLSGKIPSDSELINSIETVGPIREAKILYINTGIFIRSVDFFFCLRIRFTISSVSEGGRKMTSSGAPRKYNGEIFE